MTALPLRDFTDAERERLEAIEAAPAVSESVQRRLLQALFFADAPWMPAEEFDAGTTDPRVKARFDALADAALAVLSGPSPALPRPNSNGQVHSKGDCPECGRRIATRNGKIMYHYRAGYVSECTGKGRAPVAGPPC